MWDLFSWCRGIKCQLFKCSRLPFEWNHSREANQSLACFLHARNGGQWLPRLAEHTSCVARVWGGSSDFWFCVSGVHTLLFSASYVLVTTLTHHPPHNPGMRIGPSLNRDVLGHYFCARPWPSFWEENNKSPLPCLQGTHRLVRHLDK